MSVFTQISRLLAPVLASVSLVISLSSTSFALAQKGSAEPKKGQSLETSKKIKFKEKTTLDFDEAKIDGSAKSPFASMVNSRDQDFNKGFIKIRTQWHDQMVMSLSGLSGN